LKFLKLNSVDSLKHKHIRDMYVSLIMLMVERRCR